MIDFDAGDDTFTSKVVDKVLTVVGKLTGGFVEEDDAVDIVRETVGGEEDIAVIAAVVVGIGDV